MRQSWWEDGRDWEEKSEEVNELHVRSRFNRNADFSFKKGAERTEALERMQKQRERERGREGGGLFLKGLNAWETL